jgi:hypothetical protein
MVFFVLVATNGTSPYIIVVAEREISQVCFGLITTGSCSEPNKKWRNFMRVLITVLLTAAILFTTTGIAQSAADTDMEILLQKVKADKKLLVANNMGLTDAEGKQFWPLYEAYQKDLQQINHKLGNIIKEYAEAFNKGPLPDGQAKMLMNEALMVEEAEVKLKKTYAERIRKVLPATKTARYIQIENKIRALLKAELAQDIPLVY